METKDQLASRYFHKPTTPVKPRPDGYADIQEWAKEHKLSNEDLCDIFRTTHTEVARWFRRRPPTPAMLDIWEIVSDGQLHRSTLMFKPYWRKGKLNDRLVTYEPPGMDEARAKARQAWKVPNNYIRIEGSVEP